MVPDALTAAVFAVVRAAETAGWGEPEVAVATPVAGRPAFVKIQNAATLRKAGIAKLLAKLPTSISGLTPSQLEPAHISVSCSSTEEAFFGSSVHVHIALTDSETIVSLTSPTTLANLDAFKAALVARLSSPNDFD